ncbi:F-box protein At4g00755-like [Andrographis paniculata]|uniref:F-box protein At4g00755-like n=1 Tax=Andrographis paniculata TaxID=175694 RepID=UPI0021E7F618|nr:F-box protein At4g00755-like [Andrographis paniculata]
MDQQRLGPLIDFLQFLGTDLSSYIMNFLDDPADVVRASAVSSSWREFVISNGFAKGLCIKAFPQLSSVVSIVKGGEGAETSSEAETNNGNNTSVPEKEHKVYASLLQALTKSKVSPRDCIATAVSASSTDNYPDESIVNTLNPRDRFIRRASYWSSKGHSDPEVPESLIYKLRAGLWVLTEIDIQPFEAFFQPGKPLYSPKSVRFRIGHPKPSSEIGNTLDHLPLQKPADDKFVWTYTSPEFPMMQANVLQPFKLPEPVLCIGGYLQIELLGRVQRQEMDGLFYICVCYVRVLGRPLFPAFDIEIQGPEQQLLLKYCPERIGLVLESSPSSQVPHFRHLEEEMLWERIGLLEDLLRGIQQGPNNPFRLDDDNEDGIHDGGVAL